MREIRQSGSEGGAVQTNALVPTPIRWMPVFTGMTFLPDTPQHDAGSPLAFQTKNGDSIDGTENGTQAKGAQRRR